MGLKECRYCTENTCPRIFPTESRSYSRQITSFQQNCIFSRFSKTLYQFWSIWVSSFMKIGQQYKCRDTIWFLHVQSRLETILLTRVARRN